MSVPPRESEMPRASTRVIAIAFAVLTATSVLGSLLRPAAADPSIIDNPDGTSDAVWDFTNPADYGLANAQIAGGTVSLARPTTWWNSTTAADFAGPDSATNVDVGSFPGDVVLANTTGPSTLVLLQPGPATGEDAWLDRNNPNQNHGGDTTMVLDGRNPQSRPVLRFDLSAVPANAVIDAANLYLYESAGIGGSFVASVYQVTATWDEAQVTWNDRLTGTPWGGAGGDWNNHVIGQLTLDNSVGWKSWNVTQPVDLWYRGRIANQGMILNAPNTGADADKTFYTSDYAVDPTLRPRLEIRYRVMGATGEYVSRVGGPGTTAAWETIAWNPSVRSAVADEFNGASLDARWTWMNTPTAYDVGTTMPGHLHVLSTANSEVFGGVFTGNALWDVVVGNFSATMKFTSDPNQGGQKVGLMALLTARDWYAVGKHWNGAGAVNWRVRSTVDAATTTRVDVNSGNPNPAWVRLVRTGNTFETSTSVDGIAWTVQDTYAPAYEYPAAIRLAFFIADGNAGVSLAADIDYLRVSHGNDATASMQTRTGDTTPVDGTWSGWSPAYLAPSGSAMAGSSRFIEYRLSFAVTSPDHFSVVSDANLSWFQYVPSGTVETNDLVPGALAAWGTLTAVHAPNGESIAYEYSLDSGGNWTPVVPPADLSAVSAATGRIRFRATLSTTDTLVTPSVSEIRVTYTHPLDHFSVTASPSVAAGAPFTVTVTAKDVMNATIVSWSGTVALAARLVDGVTPGGGILGTTSLAISTGGTATLSTQTYTKAETIRIHATDGSSSGLSDSLVVSPGPVTRVVVTPDNATLTPFDTRVFSGTAFDAYDNPVPGVSFNWTVVGGVGSLNATTGASVLFTASPPPANGTLQMAFGAVLATAPIQVASGIPPWILIGSPAAGAHITGVVPIAYSNSTDSVSVQFDYDDGSGWSLIGTTGVLDGTYFWDASPLDFTGGRLRAIVTNNKTITNATVVAPIEVDNTAPAISLGAITDDQAGTGTLAISYTTDTDVVRVDFTYFDGVWRSAGSDVTVDGSYTWSPGVPINGVTLRAVAVDDVNLVGEDLRAGVGTYAVGSDPPAIAAIPDVHVLVGGTYSLNLTFYVSDPDTPLSALTITNSDPANVSVNPGAYPSLDILFGFAGAYTVTLWVSDGTDTAWRLVRVIASAQSPPALASPLSAVAFDEDTTTVDAFGLPLTAFFSDPDLDPLAFVVLDAVSVSSRINGNGTLDLWASSNWFGTEVLRVRATDPAGGFAEAAFPVTVRPVNDAPILVSAFPPPTFDEDTIAPNAFGGNASVRFSDVDGDSLVLAVLGGTDVFARVNGDGTIDLWAAANWSGSETIRVRATDPIGASAEGTVSVTVRAVNDPPVVASPLPAITFDEDATAADALGGSMAPYFLDREGDPLTFSVLGATEVRFRINPNGTIDLWSSADWFGAEGPVIRATDTSGAFAEAPFSVTVRPINDAPVLAAIAAITMTEGESRTLDLRPFVSDVDTALASLVVTTDKSSVRVNGLVLTMSFPTDVTESQITVTVSDGAAAASRVVRVSIVPPLWKPALYVSAPLALAMVIGVFVQRARWRPAKAFLVDENRRMLREFTLDKTCEVTFEQVVGAGALDAVEKPVKVAKYRAQTVRGDALAVTLLAYGPVTAEQIEFAREMLVNIQDKFDGRVKGRLQEARAAEALLEAARADLEGRTASFDVRSRAFSGVFDAAMAAQAKTASEKLAIHATSADLEHREALLRQERQAAEEARGALAAERKEFETLSHRLQDELQRRRAEVEAQETSLGERSSHFAQQVDEFEAVRAEKTQWIASKDIELEARAHTLNEREAEVRTQAEENARQLADLAAREEAYEIEGDRLDQVRAELEAREAELAETARTLESRTAELRELDAQKAQEFRTWSETMESQGAMLREQKDAFDRESQDARNALTEKRLALEEKEKDLTDREAKARASVEWAMRREDESKVRESAAEDALRTANDLKAQVDKERAELSRRESELEAREREVVAEARRQTEAAAKHTEALRAEEAALAARRTDMERETAARDETLREAAADLARKVDLLEERTVVLFTREDQASSLRAALEQERSDVDTLKQQLDAKQVELNQVAQRLDEQSAKLLSETEDMRQSVAAKEADLIAQRERVERESQTLQETLGAKAQELANREKALAAKEREATARVQETEARVREVDHLERQSNARAEELAERASTLAGQQRDMETRAGRIEESARSFALEQEHKLREWESLQESFRSHEVRSKSEAEARLGQLEGRTQDLDRREREVHTAVGRIEEERTRLALAVKENAAKEKQLAEAGGRLETRMAEMRAVEAELLRARQAFEAERAAWEPRHADEMKRLEAMRTAATEQSQQSERLLEDAQRRASVAADAEGAAKRKLEELSGQHAQLDGRRAETERAERGLEAQNAQIQEAMRKLAGREIEVEAMVRDWEARGAKVEARAKEISSTLEALKMRRAELDEEAGRASKVSAELHAERRRIESEATETEARLMDVVEREKALKEREASVKTREKVLPAVEAEHSRREAALAEREAALREKVSHVDRAQLELEGRNANLDAERRTVKTANAEADSLRERAEKLKAQADAQQAEVAKTMKFLQKKAVDTLDREEQIRKREAALEERDKILESQFEIVSGKERAMEIERTEARRKLERAQTEADRLRSELAEAQADGRPAADFEAQNKDLESRLKIIQRKAMELLDREEQVRKREEEVRDRAEKLGVKL